MDSITEKGSINDYENMFFQADSAGSSKDLGALGHEMTRSTAKALMFLVLCTGSNAAAAAAAAAGNGGVLPLVGSKHSLRRAAIDLIGRGFLLWEPHLEVSKVLLGLLEMTCEADWWVPSGKYGLPLTPSGDQVLVITCTCMFLQLGHMYTVQLSSTIS